MPAVTSIQFHQFSAKHHNADRNWLVVQLNTDQPGLYGLGDASPMEADDAVNSSPRTLSKNGSLAAIRSTQRRYGPICTTTHPASAADSP